MPPVIQIYKALFGARTIRLDPDALQQESELIRGPNIDFFDERGLGLPAVYDALASQDTEEYVKLIKQVKKLFPSIKKLQLIGMSKSTKAINVELVTGERIAPQHLSTGLLYYLAYAAIPYLHPCAVLLIEEPENGLHPARIAEVMGILREVSKTTQVLIASHSPLVVNELQPEEVSVVTREPEEGTRVTPL
ncbi:MAG: ATP-binding protein, partial [Rhodospirillales bacterium]|nr:ATP-binding protein [Rhodospirillales bacterium]